MDDQEMVRLALAEHRQAYELLGRRIDSVLRAFFARFPDEDLAAELAQRTALALLEKFQTRQNLPQDTLDGWILSFAMTQTRRWFTWLARERRRAQLRVEYLNVLPISPTFDEHWYANDERLRLLMQIIERLPLTVADAYLAHLHGYRYVEIADMLETSETTARRRVALAQRRVAKRWALLRATPSTYQTAS